MHVLLQLRHKDLEVYKVSFELLDECYKLIAVFPKEEKHSLAQQIRRASVSVLLNIAEGSSRISLIERKRFFEIARGSVVEVDTAFQIALHLNYVTELHLEKITLALRESFKKLSTMIKTLSAMTHK
jgi:four helix bundle protein